ncbi:MAG: hypothetical protein U5R49_12675 [Deltaproteobacteria bacterium]|nr:hypothetical protein [Deltaproteobacteria bacterium]
MRRMEDQHAVIKGVSLNMERLKAVEGYELNECAWFFSKKDNYWELSNMAGGMPIILMASGGTQVNSFIRLQSTARI